MAASYQFHVVDKNENKKQKTTFLSQNMALNLLRLDDNKENNKFNVIYDYM